MSSIHPEKDFDRNIMKQNKKARVHWCMLNQFYLVLLLQ